jgi:hypothetical protein
VLLDEAARGSFAGIPVDVNWITALTGYAQVAARFADRHRIDSLYSLLSPFARYVEWHGGTVNGCVAYYLGLLAAGRERFEEALRHFTEAQEVHYRLGARFCLVATDIARGHLLLRFGSTADRRQARSLLEAAGRQATEYAFPSLDRDASNLLRQGETPRTRARGRQS